jgi:predicted DNA-binding protein (UPF0251 family)
MARNNDEMIQIPLSDSESLDIIRLEDLTVLIVISERRGVQRRTVAKIDGAAAIKVAKFLVGINGGKDGSEGK